MKNLAKFLFPLVLCVGPVANAQLFWNPPEDSTSYSGVGGNGSWDSQVTNFWNGANNVLPTANGTYVFEGTGTVNVPGNNDNRPPQTGNITFQNLTGDYSFNGSISMNGNLTATTTGQTIAFNSLPVNAGSNRIITNNGTGLVSINNTLRFGGGGNTSLTFAGTGNSFLGGTGNMGGTLTKNGTGHLTIGGSMNSFTAGMVLNDGSMWMNNTGTSLTWNGGSLVYDLDESDFSSNQISLSNAFTKDSGSEFAFDFGGFNVSQTGTYTLLSFSSTTFDASDFSASNITFEGGLTGSFVVGSEVLQFTVIPEPGTYGLIFGSLAIFGVLLRRRLRQ